MRITFIFLFLLAHISYAQKITPTPYPFLEEIVKHFPNVRDLALTDQGREAVFTAQSVMGDLSVLISCRFEEDQWRNPQVLPFSGNYSDMEPFFSKDGLILYFVSNRPLGAESREPKDYDIWYVTRETINNKWSKPINLGSPVNTEKDEFYPIITDSKTIYFTLDDPELGYKDDIYKSVFNNGKYLSPERLDSAINSDGYEFNAFVSSDERFIIYSCYNRDDGMGSGDLYISFNKDGKWQNSVPLGPNFNTNKMEYCPFVDEQNGILYFTSKRLKSKGEPWNIESLDALKNELSTYENGSSRLYQIPFNSTKID